MGLSIWWRQLFWTRQERYIWAQGQLEHWAFMKQMNGSKERAFLDRMKRIAKR